MRLCVGAGEEEALKHFESVASWANRGDLLCIFLHRYSHLLSGGSLLENDESQKMFSKKITFK